MKLLVVGMTLALLQTSAHAGAPEDEGIPPSLSEKDLPPPLHSEDIPDGRAPHVVPLPHEARPTVPMPAPSEVEPAVPPPRPEDVLPPVPLPSPEEIPAPWAPSVPGHLRAQPGGRAPLARRRASGWLVRCYATRHGATREIRCQLTAADENPAPPSSDPPSSAKKPAPSAGETNERGACGNGEESRLFALLNEARRQRGIDPLECSARAVLAARSHSQDMCSRRFFGHFSPEGDTPAHRLSREGIRHATAGENVARGYTTAEAAHVGWMGSPAHRRTLLDPRYTHVGVGLVECDSTGPYWTQVFFRAAR